MLNPCPKEADPELLHCPRGCGFVTMATPSLKWGPWRMAVHLLSTRCPRPLVGASQSTYAATGYVPPSLRSI